MLASGKCARDLTAVLQSCCVVCVHEYCSTMQKALDSDRGHVQVGTGCSKVQAQTQCSPSRQVNGNQVNSCT
jgi:hypothetical protein